MTTHEKKKRRPAGWILLSAAAALVLLAVVIWLVGPGRRTSAPGQDPAQLQNIHLADGLTICSIDSYSGMYVEDGSNETVQNVMMIVLENTTSADLQLARIFLTFSDCTAEFEATNLPAGEKAVVLEKSRQTMSAGTYQAAESRNVVFFAQPMALQEERIRIEGSSGTLELTNISGADIPGNIYIYYKNSRNDLFYGGITYRIGVKEGLSAGESIRLIAGHYHPDQSRIVLVDCGA